MKKNAFFLFIFLSYVFNASDFDSLRAKWIEDFESSNFIKASKSYQALSTYCQGTKIDIEILECMILKNMHDTYSDENSLPENNIKDAIDILGYSRKTNLYSTGLIEVFDALIYQNLYLQEADVLDIEKSYKFYINNEDLDVEDQVYVNVSYATFLATIFFNFSDAIKYIEKSFELINASSDDYDWNDYKNSLSVLLIEYQHNDGQHIAVIENSISLLSELIKTDQINEPTASLVETLMFLGNLSMQTGDDNRSMIFYSLAYETLRNKGDNTLYFDLDRQVDTLIYKILPSLNCADSEEFLMWIQDRKRQLTEQGQDAEFIHSYTAEWSMLTSEIFCSDDINRQRDLATKIHQEINNEIDSYLSDKWGDEALLSGFVPLNFISALYDISNFIPDVQYKRTLNNLEKLIKIQIESEAYVHEYDDLVFDYSLGLFENICIKDPGDAKININLVVELFQKNGVKNLSSMYGIYDLLFKLVVVPASCGYAQEVKPIFELVQKNKADLDIFTLIPQISYDYSAILTLATSNYQQINDSTTIEILKHFNREPKELEMKLSKINNNNIKSYIEFQNNLNTYDNFLLNLGSITNDDIGLLDELESFFSNLDLQIQDVSKFAVNNFYYDFTVDDLKSMLGPNDALIIYSAWWLDNLSEFKNYITQICITTEKISYTNKIVKEDDLEFISKIDSVLLEDLILKENSSENIAKEYYEIFSSNFECDPAKFKNISYITNFNLLPNLFYKDDYVFRETNNFVYQNIYSFLKGAGRSFLSLENYAGYGDVNFEGTKYLPLPSSQEEILFSGDFFDKPLIYLKENANKDNVKSATKTFLHFATHNAYLQNNYNVFTSALVLSPNEKNERYIFAEDIAKNDFSNSVIILSACNTFANVRDSRNSTSDLYNAFNIAGASAIISTSWDIDSSSASNFIKHFFMRQSENLGVVESFRLSQIYNANSQEYSHPYYWAGFNLHF